MFDKIYPMRKSAGLTRKELGKRIGYTSTAIYYWETGRRKISAKALAAIARALSVPISALFPNNDGGDLDDAA